MACTFNCNQGRRCRCDPLDTDIHPDYRDEDMRCDSTLSAVALAVFAAVTLGCALMLILAACGVLL